MEDYRDNPQDSPKVWCIHCQKLVHANERHVKMRTVFCVTSSGLYPYGVCNSHVISSKNQAIVQSNGSSDSLNYNPLQSPLR